MTVPTYVPAKYAAADSDYNKAKVDRSGGLRMEYFSTAVTAAAASDVVVGLVPFQKGARFILAASQIHVTDMDTDSDLTLDVGYVYDDNATYTNDGDAFASQVTTGQAGGLITFDEHAGLSFEAEAPGWITLTIGVGGTSYTTIVIKGQAVLAYDG